MRKQTNSAYLVVHVANEQTLGREGIRLNLDVGTGHRVEERRLAHIRKPAHDESALQKIVDVAVFENMCAYET